MTNLNGNLEALFSKMDNFISTKTVVGQPEVIGDIIIVPLVDVCFGVGTGASVSSEDKNTKDNAAGGLGAKISPTAVLVIQGGSAQLVSVKNQSSINKLIEMVPNAISKLNFGKDKAEEKETSFDDQKISE